MDEEAGGMTAQSENLSNLACKDVTMSFGGFVALNGVSLDFPAGRVTGLVGPNGAGKTVRRQH